MTYFYKFYLAFIVLYTIFLNGILNAVQPVDNKTVILSDSLLINMADEIADFNGNVIVTKENTKLKADNIKIKYDSKSNSKNTVNSKIDKIYANGNIEIKTNADLAYGDKAEYDVKKNIVTLYENVKLIQNKNKILANKVTINVVTGKINIDSDKKSTEESGRVRAIIHSNIN